MRVPDDRQHASPGNRRMGTASQRQRDYMFVGGNDTLYAFGATISPPSGATGDGMVDRYPCEWSIINSWEGRDSLV
jgi:hypothetical protein